MNYPNSKLKILVAIKILMWSIRTEEIEGVDKIRHRQTKEGNPKYQISQVQRRKIVKIVVENICQDNVLLLGKPVVS